MGLLKKILLGIRSIGFQTALQLISYAFRRDRLDSAQSTPPVDEVIREPGLLQSYEPIERGAYFRFESADLEVVFLDEGLVRLTWSPGRLPIGYALVERDWPGAELEVEQVEGLIGISSEALKLSVSDQGSILFFNVAEKVLREERPPIRAGNQWSQRVKLFPEEHIYGLGERAAPLNLRGGTYRMWNRDPGGSYGLGHDPLYLCIPVSLSLHKNGSTLVFYENSFDGVMSFDENLTVAFEGGALRYYFATGSPAELLERFTALTGRPSLPPRWALGHHHSRWGFKNRADVLEVVRDFRENDLPLSAVHLDIDYMDGYRLFTVDQERFPDLPELIKELNEEGVHLVTILDVGVKRDPDYAIFRQGLEKGMFCTLPNGDTVYGPVWPGWCAFPDFSKPAVRAWWGKQYALILDAGVAGIWHDMNEPAVFAAWGESTLPLSTQHDFEGSGGNHRQGHNVYGLLMNRAGFQAMRDIRPDHRPWILSRSGWAGMQRYAWNWTGDTETSWEALRMTIATVLNLGLSGIPFTGPDIGGFSGSPSSELFTRWFQMATFFPLFRNHSALNTSRREPWTFEEPYLSIIRKFLTLRYKLLPYLYTQAWQASQSGLPMVRPLFWLDMEDPELWAVDDAFYLGEELLVAPVINEGAKSRELRLPRGSWYDFWEDELHQGPGEITLDCSLDRIPVLVAAGSVLPMEVEDQLELHVYPPGQTYGESMIYTDAGDGYGNSRLDHFSQTSFEGGVDLHWKKDGEYPFPSPSVVLQLHGAQCDKLLVDGESVPMENNRAEVGIFEVAHFD